MNEKLEIFPKILGIFIPIQPFNFPLRTKRRSGVINRQKLKKKKLELTTPVIYISKLFARCKI